MENKYKRNAEEHERTNSTREILKESDNHREKQAEGKRGSE